MWPQDRRKKLPCHLLLLLLLVNLIRLIVGEPDECELSVRVRRNLSWNVSVTDVLTLECPVHYCDKPPPVKWCQLHGTYCILMNESNTIKIEWKHLDNKSGNYSLTFLNISLDDSGLYRCEAAANTSSVSHTINVSVSESNRSNESPSNKSTTTGVSLNDKVEIQWIIYFYICAAVVTFIVIVVIISFYCLHANKASPGQKDAVQQKKQLRTTVSSTAPGGLSMCAAPKSPCISTRPPSVPERTRSIRSQPAGRHSEPSTVYDNDNLRRKSRRKQTASNGAPKAGRNEPNQVSIVIQTSDIYDNVEQETEGDSFTLVYAALNHNSEDCPVRTSAPMDDYTEYAAIRVCP
ncbi:B- and T-lymphocyte attenuator [Amia ocellicauda]|uniref:B- and T-lymphocyte attenuator n=1 Tax=Amia ocellicauda TaxID=2972642 RepID=UPI0034638B3B